MQLLKEKAIKEKKAKEALEYVSILYLILWYREKQNQKIRELQQQIQEVEAMEVESAIPKGVLPADFFDDPMEREMAMGKSRKEIEKKAQQYLQRNSWCNY